MKIATWNINGGYGVDPDDPHKLLGYENLLYFITQLETIDADVVCLQEVHVNAERSQAHEIARALGYSSVFQTSASESHIDPNYQLANAILAKQSFRTTRAVTLPRPHFPLALPLLPSGERAAIHDKVLQIAQISELTVGNTHLLPLHVVGARWESSEGRELAAATAKVIASELQTPLVLCGDFNDPNVPDLMPELIHRLRLTDVLPDEPSVPHANVRIDYIFISSDLAVCSSSIPHALSDHFPCLVTLAM